jgi:Mn-dependent DtxR family transcriptional regulator
MRLAEVSRLLLNKVLVLRLLFLLEQKGSYILTEQDQERQLSILRQRLLAHRLFMSHLGLQETDQQVSQELSDTIRQQVRLKATPTVGET